jgi:hypothetical protein
MRTVTGTLRGSLLITAGVLFATLHAGDQARADEVGIAGKAVTVKTDTRSGKMSSSPRR